MRAVRRPDARREGRLSEATVNHRQQRFAVLRLEDELGLVRDDRSVRPALRRIEDEATGSVDHPKDVVVAVDLVACGSEGHGPDPADPQIAR
jgi:hypothetical protein